MGDPVDVVRHAGVEVRAATSARKEHEGCHSDLHAIPGERTARVTLKIKKKFVHKLNGVEEPFLHYKYT